MKKYSILGISLSLMVLAACGGDNEEEPEPEEAADEEATEVSGDESTDEEETVDIGDLTRFQGDDVAEWLRAEPGTFHGDDYDEELVTATLEQAISEGADEEELYYTLLDLVAEDYRDLQAFIDDPGIVFEGESRDADEREEEELEAELNVQVLFDASGSMAASVSDGVKMDVAKDAVEDFLGEMPEGTNVSLRVYGHKGSNQRDGKEESCAGTEEVYPLSAYDEDAFSDALNQFEPTGYTPIAASIEAAQDDLADADGENVQNIVYIVSDGEETCGGDPVQAAQDLNESDIEAVVNIIGFDVNDDERDSLMEIAEAGQGEYLAADTGEEMRRQLQEEYAERILNSLTWERESHVDNYGQTRDFQVEAFDVDTEMRVLINQERNQQREALREVDLGSLDPDMMIDFINERRDEIGDYRDEQMGLIREEIRDGSSERRHEIGDEAREERRDIRDDR
ncbi:VWA domain-containing protein [Geomicrobium sp. JCM 19039]|uniref:VWA domain-containing protein n=1 Tax=Geomicrobium sp. JCM 19039 TaxID=1460636 RepID=UPI00045F4A80|nr:VWA domain-containing protein [Geomicrobium sp. JCM 19039]GAK13676.1 D-amino acid dehydrogenase large subunit [Geomicrobium sp. JCM 19039]